METLSTFKMGIISARDFYGALLGFVLKSSVALLLINTLVRLGLKGVGLYDGSITAFVMILMWVCCLGVNFFMGLAFSQPILMSKLLQGRLKTETFIKKTYRHLCVVYFCLYTVTYTLITLFVNLGFTLEQGLMDPWFLTFSIFLTQGVAFIFASGITGFISGSEFQRLGLGAVINLIGEVLAKARRQTQDTNSSKDA
jgi:hypothetical protein